MKFPGDFSPFLFDYVLLLSCMQVCVVCVCVMHMPLCGHVCACVGVCVSVGACARVRVSASVSCLEGEIPAKDTPVKVWPRTLPHAGGRGAAEVMGHVTPRSICFLIWKLGPGPQPQGGCLGLVMQRPSGPKGGSADMRPFPQPLSS